MKQMKVAWILSPAIAALFASAGCTLRAVDSSQDSDADSAASPIVSEVRAREKSLLEQHPDLGRRDGNALVLNRTDGQIELLEDVQEDSRSEGVVYAVHDYLPSIKAVIVHTIFWEGDGYLFVDQKSGRRTYLDAAPVLSPGGHHLVTASMDLATAYNPNRLQIWRLGTSGPELEWEWEAEDWAPDDPRWLNETTVTFSKHSNDYTDESAVPIPAVILKTDDGWRIVEP